jgi:hypothetical protein
MFWAYGFRICAVGRMVVGEGWVARVVVGERFTLGRYGFRTAWNGAYGLIGRRVVEAGVVVLRR